MATSAGSNTQVFPGSVVSQGMKVILFIEIFLSMLHSRLRQFLIRFQVPKTKLTQGLSVCFKDSKNVLHEILANRAWKGRAS